MQKVKLLPEMAPSQDCIDTPATSLTVAVETADLAHASNWLARSGDSQGIPPRPLMRLDHCLDEILANIIAHGGAGARTKPVSLDLEVLRHGGECRATLTVCDSGIEFNPLTVTLPKRPQRLEEAEPGGLGLLMLRKNSDQLNYSYSQGRNCLSVTVIWQTSLN